MPRTYFFMGWNRDRDTVPSVCIHPIMPPMAFHEYRCLADDVRRWTDQIAMSWDMAYGRGSMIFTPILPHMSQVKRWACNRHGAAVIKERLFLSMAVVKDDDSAITWDHEAMAKRPFQGRGV